MRVTVYSRPGCHLCEEMKATVRRVRARAAFELVEVDITGDPELERRYGPDVPVLEIDGRKAAKYRIDERRLMRALAARPKSTLP